MAGAGGVVHIQWYATVFRKGNFAAAVAEATPLSLRYGATKYTVHQSRDDMYKITQMMWFPSQADWYRYWEGPEMTEFRRRHAGHFQIPITYVWNNELAAGELGPQVEQNGAPEPEPETAPEAVA